MSDVQSLEQLLVQTIKGCTSDPAANDYERGYLNALKELLEEHAGIRILSERDQILTRHTGGPVRRGRRRAKAKSQRGRKIRR